MQSTMTKKQDIKPKEAKVKLQNKIVKATPIWGGSQK
jgi:hypothetical protein